MKKLKLVFELKVKNKFLLFFFFSFVILSSCKKESILSNSPAETININVSNYKSFLHKIEVFIKLRDNEKILEYGFVCKSNFVSDGIPDSIINKHYRYFPENSGNTITLSELVPLCSGKNYLCYSYVITENGKSTSEIYSIDVKTFFYKRTQAMPSHMTHCGTFEANGYVYFLGGNENNRNLFQFNGTSWNLQSSYTQLPNWLPEEKFCTFVLNGTVFYTTGYIYPNEMGTDSIFRYNPNATPPQPLLARFGTGIPPRFSSISFVINDKAYIALGKSNGNKLNDIYSYKLGEGFIKLPDYPGSGGEGSGVFVVDGRAYIFGGEDQKQCWEFNPENISQPWTKKNDLPFKYLYGGATNYLGIGVAGFGTLESDLFAYNPKKDVWNMIVSNNDWERVYGGSAFSYNNQLFYCGGKTPSLSPILDYYQLIE
jgi:hypothetical protein